MATGRQSLVLVVIGAYVVSLLATLAAQRSAPIAGQVPIA
jgi:hypothetical protein